MNKKSHHNNIMSKFIGNKLFMLIIIVSMIINNVNGSSLLDASYFSWLDTTWMTTLWSMFSIIYGAAWAFFNYYLLVWAIQLFSVITV